MSKLSITLTKNPTWAFKTETENRHNITFDKNNSNVLKGMAREVIQMLYHHYGCEAAHEFINEVEKGFKEHYTELNP